MPGVAADQHQPLVEGIDRQHPAADAQGVVGPEEAILHHRQIVGLFEVVSVFVGACIHGRRDHHGEKQQQCRQR